MQFETILEITRIGQEIREIEKPYRSFLPERLTGASDALKFAQALIGDENREVFLAICLNAKKQIITIHHCHIGALGASIVHPREVFKTAIMNNAHSIIVAHNHPSGHCKCSPEDVIVSKKLIEIGES